MNKPGVDIENYPSVRRGPRVTTNWPSEDVEFHQVSELGRELIFSWEECSREHNRHYALLLWWTSSGHRLMRAT